MQLVSLFECKTLFIAQDSILSPYIQHFKLSLLSFTGIKGLI